MKRRLAVLVGILAFFAQLSLTAWADEGAPRWASKLGSMNILADAKAGVTQELLVELSLASSEKESSTRRAGPAQESHASESRAEPRLPLAPSHMERLDAAKESVLSTTRASGVLLVRNFPNSPIVLVRVPTLKALEALAGHRLVRLINKDAELSPTSN